MIKLFKGNNWEKQIKGTEDLNQIYKLEQELNVLLSILATVTTWNNMLLKCYNLEQEVHRSRFAHLSKTAIAYLQMLCNILSVLPQQLIKIVDAL